MKQGYTSERSGFRPAFSFHKRGFTLLELIAVISIIGILAGLAVGVSRFARREAKVSRAEAELQMLKSALEEYRVQFGRYPDQPGTIPVSEMTELTGLVEGMVLIDPWGRPYFYCCEKRFEYFLWSNGPDENLTGDEIGKAK